MGAVVQGEVVRFDQVKGYGFITPRDGGEDVFLHVNDLLDDKHLIRPGVVVEFIREDGERGLKASSIHVVSGAPSAVSSPARVASVSVPASSSASAGGPADDGDGGLVDVLSREVFDRELTERLLTADPALSGPQIVSVRNLVRTLAATYGWIDD